MFVHVFFFGYATLKIPKVYSPRPCSVVCPMDSLLLIFLLNFSGKFYNSLQYYIIRSEY